MSCCNHCRDAGDFFTDRTAKKDLRRFRKKGPDNSTALLIESIRSAEIDISQSTLLDIGGGIGAIPFELFNDGLQYAANVDASVSYQLISKTEAERKNLLSRTEYHFGDAVEKVPKLQDADIVTLDRVICCYPNPEKLIPATASKAKKIYGVVYPRERFVIKVAIKLGNFWFKLRKSEFRNFLFPAHYINDLIQKQGLIYHNQDQTFLWNVVTYTRK